MYVRCGSDPSPPERTGRGHHHDWRVDLLRHGPGDRARAALHQRLLEELPDYCVDYHGSNIQHRFSHGGHFGNRWVNIEMNFCITRVTVHQISHIKHVITI